MIKPLETYRGTVHPSEIDHMGHMNMRYYAEKFDRATWNILIAMGVTNDYIQRTGKGCAILETLTKYIHELYADNEIYIESVVLDVTPKKLRVLHRMKKSDTGEIVATSEILGIHFDLKLRKSCEMPKRVYEMALSLKETASP
jgi:acyl-CoA thioester hydrolase